MSLEVWKTRALKAENKVEQLRNEIRMLKDAKAISTTEKVVKKVTKKVTKKAGSKPAAK